VLKSFFGRTLQSLHTHWVAWTKGVRYFTAMQMAVYQQGTTDHLEHNDNPDYWDLLLGIVKQKEFSGKNALDFACGKGRNIENLLGPVDWNRVDGVDISPANIQYCITRFKSSISHFWITGGADAGGAPSNFYDLVISTIALQHIPVYEVRKSILLDIYRTMKVGSFLSIQMGFGEDLVDPLGRPRSAYLTMHTMRKVLTPIMMCELSTLTI